MLALGIHYLTGYATATDTGNRERPEWPPHPARVFMALVAAHYEGQQEHTDNRSVESERAALKYLEALPPPALKVSSADNRTTVTHYVPVNDKLYPPNNPTRQPRTFPKTRPHDPYVFLLWPDAIAEDEQRKTLDRLCAKVTRIGHSSSFVHMWVVEAGSEPEPDLFPVGVQSRRHSMNPRRKPRVFHLRIASPGTLNYLDEQFNHDAIELFFDFKTKIAGTKGKLKKELQTRFHEHFGMQFSNALLPPHRAWPTLAVTEPYSRENPSKTTASSTAVALSPFDPNLIILSKLDGPTLGLESTAQLTLALRGTILKRCAADGNAPEWLCGHSADGASATRPHLALFPLAFAGSKHADGHVLGLALAIPREVAAHERAHILRPLLFALNEDGTPRLATIPLTLGRLGVWTLSLEERTQPSFALHPETWCHPSTTWATVTPVVLDRHPKGKTPDERYNEALQFISESCERAGLPRAVEIDVAKTSWHTGAPQSAPREGGFPLLFPHRQQFHVWLRFPVPIQGPVLIGAGRYRGYGLFKPYKSNQDNP